MGHATAYPLTYLNHSPLASSGSLPAVITKPFAAPVVLDVIASSSPVVQNTLHSVIDATLPASTPFPVPASTGHEIAEGPSHTSTLQIGQSPVSFKGDAPANSVEVLDAIAPPSPVVQSTLHTVVDARLPASTPFPVPSSTSTSPGTDDGPLFTSTPQIGQTPPVSFGGDVPANSVDALHVIAPSSAVVVQSTLHTADAKLPASTPFPVPASTSPGIDDGLSLTSTPQIGQSSPISFGGDAPANSVDALHVIAPPSPAIQSTLMPASTPFPVPASASPGIDDGPSLTSTPQIDKSPISFGGDAPANSADSGFSDLPDVVSPAIPTPATTVGGLVDTSIPNGETIGSVPLTSALPPGEIEIPTITAPATTSIATTNFSSILLSFTSG